MHVRESQDILTFSVPVLSSIVLFVLYALNVEVIAELKCEYNWGRSIESYVNTWPLEGSKSLFFG